MNQNKIIFLSIFSIFMADCSSSSKKTDAYRLNQTKLSSYLAIQDFESCSAVEETIKENRLRILKTNLDKQRNFLNYYILNDGLNKGIPGPQGETSEEASSDSAAPSPNEVTGTNNQVAGVQESDIYKTDGNYTYVLSGNTVRIVNSWPADSLSEVGNLELPGYGVEMFLTENKKLFVAYREPDVEANEVANDLWYPSFYSVKIGFKVYDVNDPQNPSLIDEQLVEGYYLTMRRIGDEIKIIQNYFDNSEMSPSNYYYRVDIWENGQYISLEEFDSKAEAVVAEYTAKLEDVTIADILGNYDGSSEPIHQQDFNCQSIYSSENIDSFGYTKISSYNPETKAMNQSLLLSPTSIIHGSSTSLYTTFTSYANWEDDARIWDRTFIHRFSLEGTDIGYLGSGWVNGSLNDQFSMDEYNDVLRLAITETLFTESDSEEFLPWRDRTTLNRVVTLGQGEGELVKLGETPGMAEGESIFSARFSGDKGFVVTFLQVDPLFTIDLSDPSAPKVVGQLKIPGFSTYIHMMDDTHLLTVGLENWTPKISIFDVTDFANPKELATYYFDTEQWGSSESVYDHKAFTYYASRNLLAIPYGYYDESASGSWENRYKSVLRLFDISTETGISLKGDVPMNDLYAQEDPGWYYWWYGAVVRRSYFADDFVYSISSFGIKSYNINDFTSEVGRVAFY